MSKVGFSGLPIGYDVKTIGAETVKVEFYDANGMITKCYGLTKPTDGGAGFAKGCLFIDTDVASGTSGLYENIGTTSSCNFNVIGAVTAGEVALTTGSVLIGAAGVGSALDVKTSGNIMVGNGTTATSVAVSGDATLSSAGALTIANGAVTRAKMSTSAASKNTQITLATIATAAGTTSGYITAPTTGTLSTMYFTGIDDLADSDTDYITFNCTNLGQNGSGTAAMLSANNTTKVTGGSALAANTVRTLQLTATGADLIVNAGDRIKFDAVVTGTLANTVTVPVVCAIFSGTT